MMSSVIGSLRVDLGMNSAAFMKGLDEAQRKLRKTQRQFAKTGAKFQSVGKAMSLGITAPVVAFGALSLKAGGNFEAAMNRVGAITGATGRDLSMMRDAAKDMGATTHFSASQAADALGFLGMAGFSAQQATEALPGTLQLAAAAGMDLAQSADIVSNVLSGYRMGVDDLARVNDVLVATFTSSNTDLVQLGEAMKYAGPIASAAGVAFEESAAAIGLMGNAGIQASMAGTSLRGAIGRLLEPTPGVAKAIKQMGFEFTDANGRLVGFDQILRQLEPHANDAGLFIELFGQRAGPAMAALVGQGADALVDLQTKLENAGGTAERIAAAQMEGFNGAVKRLKSAVEGLQIAVADSGLLDWGTKVVDKLSDMVSSLSELDPVVLRVGTVVAGLAATIGPLAIAAGAATITIGAMVPVLAVVGPTVAVVSGAVGVMALAFQRGEGIVGRMGAALRSVPFIGAGVAAARGAVRVIEFARSFTSLSAAMVTVKSIVSEVAGRIGQAFVGMGQIIGGAWFGIKADALDAVSGIVSTLPAYINPIVGVFVGAKDAIKAAWATLPAALGAPVAAAVNGVLAGVENMINKSVDLINRFVAKMPAKVRELFGWSALSHVSIERVPITVEEGAGNVVRAFKDAMARDYVGELGTSVANLASEARAAGVALGNAGRTAIDAAKAPLQSVASWREAQRMLRREGVAAAGALDDAVAEAGETAEELGDALDDAGEAGENLGGRGAGGAKKLAESLSDAEEAAKRARDALAGVGKSFLSDLVTDPTSAFANGLSGLKSLAGEAFSGAVFHSEGLFAGFAPAIQSVGTGLSALASGGAGALAGLGTALSGAMPIIGAGLAVFNLIKTFSKTEKIGQGLNLGIKGGEIFGGRFDRMEKSSFWGLVKRQFDEDSPLGKKARAAMQRQLDLTQRSLKSVYKTLGVKVPADFMDGVKLAVQRIETEGMSKDEVQAAVANVFAKYANALSQAMGQIGAKAASALASVQSILAPIGKSFDVFAGQVAKAGKLDLGKYAQASKGLARLAGGMDALSEKTGSFFEGFYSDGEKLAYAQGLISDTFAGLGLSVPKTLSGFKDLVTGQDLLTKSGRKAYAALLDIAPIFSEVAGAATKIRDAYSLDASGFVSSWEAKLAYELENSGQYSSAAIAAQNAELATQTEILRRVEGFLRRSAEAGEASAFASQF